MSSRSCTSCWIDYLCSIILLCSIVKDQLNILIGVYFWSLYSFPCLDYRCFITSPKVLKGNISSPILFFSFNTVLVILELLSFYVNAYNLTKKQFVNIYKLTCCDFDWGCTDCIDQVGKNWYLDNIESSYLWTWYSLHLLSFSLILFIRVL